MMSTKYVIVGAVAVLALFLALPMVSILKGGDNADPVGAVDSSGALEMVTADLQGTSVGCTAIGKAIWRGDIQRIDAFLKAGADINAPLKVQLPDIPEFTSHAICAAIEAIAMGQADIDLVTFVLDNGADPNVSYERSYPSGDGGLSQSIETPLALAFSADRVDVMELLLERGADPNVGVGDKGRKILTAAIGMKRQAMVDVLRKHGAKE